VDKARFFLPGDPGSRTSPGQALPGKNQSLLELFQLSLVEHDPSLVQADIVVFYFF
jgi:hypothetical protein